MYFPAYSVTNLVSSNGMIIINPEDSLLERLNSRNIISHSSLYLTDVDGSIVSTQNVDRIGNQIEFSDKIKGRVGASGMAGNW